MPKAIETPTTHRSAPAAAPIALPAKVAAAPPDDALARMLWSGSELDEVWERRDPTNKAVCVLTGAAERLGGLSRICWDLEFAEIAKGGSRAEDGPTSIYSFLALTLADLSRGLSQAHRLYWDDVNAKDDAKARRTRSASA